MDGWYIVIVSFHPWIVETGNKYFDLLQQQLTEKFNYYDYLAVKGAKE